ncbi:hypothetical protein [Haladaptatus sp. T7]|uniref:hypothetical protein n=1 Tax=Haladaptatus sp. T7 TaxID=2029368 RepID=UPI0021A25943|nr:hypothetical protein [Haladaptatus sp. T7]GKZ14956.1 hypothetical protein HAL_28370 [Haladaptatus sp. T7]
MKRQPHWLVSTFLLSIAFCVAFYGIALPPVTKNGVLALCVLAAGTAAYFVTFRWRLSLRRVATFVVMVVLLPLPVKLLVIAIGVQSAVGLLSSGAVFHAVTGVLVLTIASTVSYLELRARKRERRTTVG